MARRPIFMVISILSVAKKLSLPFRFNVFLNRALLPGSAEHELTGKQLKSVQQDEEAPTEDRPVGPVESDERVSRVSIGEIDDDQQDHHRRIHKEMTKERP